MKSLVPTLLLLFLTAGSAFAEARSIVVWLDRPQEGPPKVSVYSDEKEEIRRDVTVAEAAGLLKEAKGWGSQVSVFILSARSIETRDYLSLLVGMKENPWLQLRSVEVSDGREFSKMAEHSLRYFIPVESQIK